MLNISAISKTCLLTVSLLFCLNANALSDKYSASKTTTPTTTTTTSTTTPAEPTLTVTGNAVTDRVVNEEKLTGGYYSISFYKPNYVMPYYYTGSPYNSVYVGNTPQNEKLDRGEIKYQLSLKVPLWKDIFGYRSTLYLGYTQLSYWQAYNKYAFFRSTDYNPDLFLANEINYHLYKQFELNFLNVGAEHQSNGFGDSLERGWNRVYIEGVMSVKNLMISVKPWIVFHDSLMTTYNPDIENYLGHGQVIASYKWGSQVLSFKTYGFLEKGGKRTTGELAYAFPITSYIKGYIQAFSGYGQSLIEYNHRTNSIGIGIALNNWI